MAKTEADGRNDLGRFQKGISGNPKGAPKRKVLTKALLAHIEEHPEAAPDFVANLFEMAKDKPEAAKLIWDRLEGPLSLVTVQTATVKQIVMVPPAGAEMPARRLGDTRGHDEDAEGGA